jgi:hypothetical protein
MMRDPHIIRSRVAQMHRIPWPIPASVLIRFTDQDLDLDLAERAGRDAYWLYLNRIVSRITSPNAKPARSGERKDV